MVDYLSRLNPDISALLFSYLTPEDVIRCERLSKFWKIRSSEWMALYGLRLHWPDMSDIETPKSSTEVIQLYKTFAQKEFNFRHGRPEVVYRVTGCTSPSSTYPTCLTAGDFLAWCRDRENILWRRLSLREDGLPSPPEKLDLRSDHALKCDLIHLNKDGYVLVRFTNPDQDFWDSIYSLESQEVIWQPNSTWDDDIIIYPHPLHIGKGRIYYGAILNETDLVIAAYSFKTGILLYESAFDTNLGDDEQFLKRAYIWERDGEEYTVIEGEREYRSNYLKTITVINLTRGKMVYKHQYGYSARVTNLARPGYSFAVMVWVDYGVYKDHFSQQPDGSFKSIGRDYVLPFKNWEIETVDQSSRIVVGRTSTDMPGVGTLLELTTRGGRFHELQREHPDLLRDAPAGAKLFQIVNTHDISVASEYLYDEDDVRIVSGRRLEFTTWGETQYSKYLCEFAPQAAANRSRLTLVDINM